MKHFIDNPLVRPRLASRLERTLDCISRCELYETLRSSRFSIGNLIYRNKTNFPAVVQCDKEISTVQKTILRWDD